MNRNNSVGQILRNRREMKGLLLRQVAALLNIDTAILSKIERGERKAKKEQILQLADILDLDREDLIVHFLSDKILYEISGEQLAEKALQVAERKLKYNAQQNIKD